MPIKQKISINSNDLNRRLSNINVERMEEGEIEKVTNHYVKQLKGSGYSRKECREIIISGALNWKRRIERRKEENLPFYRNAAGTLKNRIKKKLLDPVRWYREKVENVEKAAENKAENTNEVRTKRKGMKRKVE